VGGEHKLRVFENKMLRRVFGPKTDKVTATVGVGMMR